MVVCLLLLEPVILEAKRSKAKPQSHEDGSLLLQLLGQMFLYLKNYVCLPYCLSSSDWTSQTCGVNGCRDCFHDQIRPVTALNHTKLFTSQGKRPSKSCVMLSCSPLPPCNMGSRRNGAFVRQDAIYSQEAALIDCQVWWKSERPQFNASPEAFG